VGQIIVDIEKNSREIIRVEVSDFKGKELINLRIWFQDFDGGYKPTQKGITLDISQYDDLKNAVEKIGQYIDDKKCGRVPEMNNKNSDKITETEKSMIYDAEKD
jgi:hypothetical protein